MGPTGTDSYLEQPSSSRLKNCNIWRFSFSHASLKFCHFVFLCATLTQVGASYRAFKVIYPHVKENKETAHWKANLINNVKLCNPQKCSLSLTFVFIYLLSVRLCTDTIIPPGFTRLWVSRFRSHKLLQSESVEDFFSVLCKCLSSLP